MTRKFTILMATYNGEKYLKEQLDSIYSQDYKHWALYISDDGSKDNTLNILYDYNKLLNNKFVILDGPKQGFCQNFLSLCNKVEPKTDFYVWSDQDDIWLHNKLSHILNILDPIDNKIPVLYSGRTILVDKNNNQYGLSPLLNYKPLEFKNSLVQCCGGGNTMVFNRPALELIKLGYKSDLFSHDWWAYQIISGSGGKIIFDVIPLVRYRQHESNLIGIKFSFNSKLYRLNNLISRIYRKRIEKNLNTLSLYNKYLTDDNKQVLNNLLIVHNSNNPLKRLLLLYKTKIYRQNFHHQLALYLMALFKLI
jgi:glycosyltransferase involved in cell wall biosynthesis